MLATNLQSQRSEGLTTTLPQQNARNHSMSHSLTSLFPLWPALQGSVRYGRDVVTALQELEASDLASTPSTLYTSWKNHREF